MNRDQSRHLGVARLALALIAVLAVRTPTALGADDQPVSLAGQLIDQIEAEIDTLAIRERGADEAMRLGFRAAINYRITAAELISGADAAGRAGSIGFVAGYRLARHREIMDAMFLDPDDLDDVRVAALTRFNGAAVDSAHRIRTVDAAALDAGLVEIFSPLVSWIAQRTGVRPVSHWPAPATGPGPTPDAAISAPIHLARAVEESGLSAPARDALTRRLAAAPPDATTAWREKLARLLSVGEAVKAFSVTHALAAEEIGALARQLDEAALLLVESGDTPELHRLERAVAVLERVERLDAQRMNVRSLVPSLRLAGSRTSVARLETVITMLDRMSAYRALERPRLPRDLLKVLARLQRQYETSEVAVIEHLPRFIDEPDALADPSVVSLLDHQRSALDAVQLMHELPAWLEIVRRVDPQAYRRSTAQLKRLSAGLVDSGRAGAARDGLERFGASVGRLERHPFEDTLATGRPFATTVTGGRADELLAVLDRRRRAFVAAWGLREDADDTASDLEDVGHLLDAMQRSVTVMEHDDDPALLNRWAGWEMPESFLRSGRASLPARLKLATIAVIDGDAAGVRDQLDRIESQSSVAQLVAWIESRLHDALIDLPTGPAGVLGQTVHPPADDALLLAGRRTYADICRAIVEAAGAQRRSDASTADAMFSRANALARDMLAGATP